MKIFCGFLFLSAALMAAFPHVVGGNAMENAEEISGGDIPSLIIGKWTMLDENGSLKASLIFKNSRHYEMTEVHDDGFKVGRKGEYKLDAAAKPCAIDLCLEKCGAAGSEWTTYFGIMRLLSKDKMEIRTSPSDTRPGGFDSADKKYTMILSRDN